MSTETSKRMDWHLDGDCSTLTLSRSLCHSLPLAWSCAAEKPQAESHQQELSESCCCAGAGTAAEAGPELPAHCQGGCAMPCCATLPADSQHRLLPGGPTLPGSAGARVAAVDESSSKATQRFKEKWVKHVRNQGVRKTKGSSQPSDIAADV